MDNEERAASPTPCEECLYFEYDELSGQDICVLPLDQDEYISFLSRKSRGCPYFRPGGEYGTAKRQGELPGAE